MKLPALPSPSRAKPGRNLTAARPTLPLPPLPLPPDLKRRLDALRRRYRLVVGVTALCMLLGAVSLLFLLQGRADWTFDLPWAVRAFFLLLDLALLGSICHRHFRLPLRKKFGLAETALLVEKKWPQLRQSLITAVELAEGKPHATRGSPQLVDLVLKEARARAAPFDFEEVVPTGALRRWVVLGGAAMLGTLVLAGMAWPASFALLERIFLLNVPLPTKTLVVAITRDMTVPIGSDVEISARAEGIIPVHGRVTLAYSGGSPEEFPLTVLPDRPATFSFTVRNVQQSFPYRFHLNDGNGEEFTVRAEVAPALAALECMEIYPAYTGLPPQKLPVTGLSLLAGSHLQIKAVSTLALKSAAVILSGPSRQMAMTLDDSKTRLTADLPIPVEHLTGFSIHLVDKTGLGSVNDTVYPIEIVPDKPPEVKILEPGEQRETITVRAKPVIIFVARDDFGLTRLSLDYQLVPPAVAGEKPAPPEVRHIPLKINSAQEGTRYQYVLAVAAQSPAWQEGWTVTYWIKAVDNNTATGPGITKTGPKEFEIVTPAEKEAEIRARIKQSAADIEGLSDTQQKVSTRVEEAIPRK